MKKLMLVGVIALGSMCFSEGEVDCFGYANSEMIDYHVANLPTTEDERDAIWDAAFYGCLHGAGQELGQIDIVVTK